jgi:ABC-type uncharacterized transport system permease subunit
MILSGNFTLYHASGLLALTLYGLLALLTARAQVEGRTNGAQLFLPWLAAWLAHGVVIALDVIDLQTHTARFGFAPALSLTLWLVIGGYALEHHLWPLQQMRRNLALLGAGAVLLMLIYPGQSYVQLASAWLPLHWALGMASYGLFAVAVLHAVLMSASERSMRALAVTGGLPLLTLEKLTFRFVTAGFVLLSAALLVGGWSAPVLRGDHKTVFAVLGWVVFAALLIGRVWLGWRGKKALRWLYAGVFLLLLSYVGSRFVLEVILQKSA